MHFTMSRGIPSIAVYPKMHKSGLGNLLWMWAKAYCWARDHDLPLLTPNWVQWDWKRYIQFNPDKRNYLGYFNNDGYIGGWRRSHMLASYRRIRPEQYEPGLSRRLVVFDSMGDFTPLIGRHKMIQEAFCSIVRPAHLPDPKDYPDRYIALHVRMGDFSPVDVSEIQHGKTNMRLPLEWYRDALRACRNMLGQDIPAVIFSDGTPGELELLLKEKNIQLANGSSAMSDLIALSRACLLVASRSSFSLWAAYIGQMPVIYHKGARPWFEPVVHPEDSIAWEIEWNSCDDIPSSFFEHTVNC